MPVSPAAPGRTPRRVSARGAGFIACTLGAAALGGCGDAKQAAKPVTLPEVQVRAVVRQFGVASAAKDYQAICRRLIAKTLSDNVEELGLPCEKAFEQGLKGVQGATLRIDGIRLDGASRAFVKVHTTALGQAPSDDTLELVRVGTRWRISSLSAPASAVPKPAQVAFW